jgi:8-oxo-dGTP diphosphatase
MITVVAAVIEAESLILICQRRRDDKFPLRWEFPGGKVERSETPQRALARELEEELGVHAEIGREIYRTRHRYQELADEIELIFYSANLGAEPGNLAFERMVWTPRNELGNFDFLPADLEFIELVMRGELHL